MGILQSRIPVRHDEEEMEEYRLLLPPQRERYMRQCVPLHKAALEGNWEAARILLDNHPSLLSAPITEGGETALHIAAIEGHETFVIHLLDRMRGNNSHLQVLNKKGCTALTFVAASGNFRIAELMLRQHIDLPQIRGGPNSVTPLFMAVEMGHCDVATLLFIVSQEHFASWSDQDQLEILLSAINSGLYDLARDIVTFKKDLAVLMDSDGNSSLQALASNPSAFCENACQPVGLFRAVATKVLVLMREEEKPNEPCNAYGLFDCLWNSMITVQRQLDVENGDDLYDRNTLSLGFTAAESGNYQFLKKLIDKDPSFMYKVDPMGRTIFHIAIVHRHVEVFNLIYRAQGMKNLMATLVDGDGNNMLHLAAMMSPPDKLSDIPGAALQMQREVLWYKNVEKLLPLNGKIRNHEGQTPPQLFLIKHRQLMKDGEKEMKKIAQYFMLVSTLITAVVFASAFTVPGGYDNDTGVPVLLKRGYKLFIIFPVSEALATLSSLVSVLMFLSILTSPYKENDFLTTLPFYLVSGVMALLVSVMAMMATFSVSLLPYAPKLTTITIVLEGLLLCVPLMSVVLKYHILIRVMRHTYGSRRLFVSTNRLPA